MSFLKGEMSGEVLTLLTLVYERDIYAPSTVHEDLAGLHQSHVTSSAQMPTLDKEIHLSHEASRSK